MVYKYSTLKVAEMKLVRSQIPTTHNHSWQAAGPWLGDTISPWIMGPAIAKTNVYLWILVHFHGVLCKTKVASSPGSCWNCLMVHILIYSGVNIIVQQFLGTKSTFLLSGAYISKSYTHEQQATAQLWICSQEYQHLHPFWEDSGFNCHPLTSFQLH